MNEKAINTVLTNYAVETANLRIQVATLQTELEDLKAVQYKVETKEKK
ncbi:hypothetical protein [Carnobacterium sp.]